MCWLMVTFNIGLLVEVMIEKKFPQILQITTIVLVVQSAEAVRVFNRTRCVLEYAE